MATLQITPFTGHGKATDQFGHYIDSDTSIVLSVKPDDDAPNLDSTSACIGFSVLPADKTEFRIPSNNDFSQKVRYILPPGSIVVAQIQSHSYYGRNTVLSR